MKITHQGANFTELTGYYTDKVVFPDSTEGQIEFGFTYDVEFQRIKEVTNGLLLVSKGSSVTFSKVSMLWQTRIGRPCPEEWDVTGIICSHIGKVADLMPKVEVEVKFKNI